VLYARNLAADLLNGGSGFDQAQIDTGADPYAEIEQLLS
jgi:hypothetical protein